jgi:hypothetical protein
MVYATPFPFDLPAVARKKLTVTFDGGNQSSDGGVLLLRAAEQKLGIIACMAAALPDRRYPTRVRHKLFEIIAARVLGIGCGYEDGIDQNALRTDPALTMAVGPLARRGWRHHASSSPNRILGGTTRIRGLASPRIWGRHRHGRQDGRSRNRSQVAERAARHSVVQAGRIASQLGHHS